MEIKGFDKALLMSLLADEINRLTVKEFEYDEMLTEEEKDENKKIIKELLNTLADRREHCQRLLYKIETN